MGESVPCYRAGFGVLGVLGVLAPGATTRNGLPVVHFRRAQTDLTSSRSVRLSSVVESGAHHGAERELERGLARAIPLLIALTLMTLASCGDDDGTAGSAPTIAAWREGYRAQHGDRARQVTVVHRRNQGRQRSTLSGCPAMS